MTTNKNEQLHDSEFYKVNTIFLNQNKDILRYYAKKYDYNLSYDIEDVHIQCQILYDNTIYIKLFSKESDNSFKTLSILKIDSKHFPYIQYKDDRKNMIINFMNSEISCCDYSDVESKIDADYLCYDRVNCTVNLCDDIYVECDFSCESFLSIYFISKESDSEDSFKTLSFMTLEFDTPFIEFENDKKNININYLNSEIYHYDCTDVDFNDCESQLTRLVQYDEETECMNVKFIKK